MKQSRASLAQTIAARTLKGVDEKKLSQEVAAYLLQERRVGELESVLRDVQAYWAQEGVVEVIARCAHPLSGEVKRDIKSKVKQLYPAAKSILITEVRDPEVVGGVKLVMPHQQFDLTIEAKLAKFKQLTAAGKE